MREHGWLPVRHERWRGWVYECFFCKRKLIFYNGYDHGSEYYVDGTTIVGWNSTKAPHEAGPLTAKWLNAASCNRRSLDLEEEFKVAVVMAQ